MVEVDRYFLLGVLGIVLAVVFAAGEFLGWWDQLGEFGFWSGLLLALAGFGLYATRGQARGIQRAVSALGAAIAQGFASTQESTGRVEQGLLRLEGHTAETVALLRDIRDRLPPAPAPRDAG